MIVQHQRDGALRIPFYKDAFRLQSDFLGLIFLSSYAWIHFLLSFILLHISLRQQQN